MDYIRTKQGTDWVEETWKDRLIRTGLFFIPEANPTYRSKMHLIQEWVIEFDDSGVPCREIGFDIRGQPIVAGPSDQDYGFWLDTGMTIESFHGAEFSESEFESLWRVFIGRSNPTTREKS